jgi:hypothetical protein
MPAEDIPVRDPILSQRIDQRHGHMVLSRNICETLWPVFSCKNLICHIEKSTRKLKKEISQKEITTQPMDTSCRHPCNPIVSPTSQA